MASSFIASWLGESKLNIPSIEKGVDVLLVTGGDTGGVGVGAASSLKLVLVALAKRATSFFSKKLIWSRLLSSISPSGRLASSPGDSISGNSITLPLFNVPRTPLLVLSISLVVFWVAFKVSATSFNSTVVLYTSNSPVSLFKTKSTF